MGREERFHSVYAPAIPIHTSNPQHLIQTPACALKHELLFCDNACPLMRQATPRLVHIIPNCRTCHYWSLPFLASGQKYDHAAVHRV